MTPYTILHLLLAGLSGLIIGIIIALAMTRRPDFMDTDDSSEFFAPDAPVDPWELQRTVMAASDQDLPDCPALTKGTLLYGALVMEEVGETLDALDRCLATALLGEHQPTDAEMLSLWAIREKFAHYADALQADAKAMRAELAKVGPIYMPLSDDEAVPLLDGVNDVIVVTCGLTNAAGLPGAAAYTEVQDSNLSKRNPDTGKIDKTPDGKWIKGREYVAPNLPAILAWSRAPA